MVNLFNTAYCVISFLLPYVFVWPSCVIPVFNAAYHLLVELLARAWCWEGLDLLKTPVSRAQLSQTCGASVDEMCC